MFSGKLEQFLQEQDSSQYRPYVKHSQYIFKHLLLAHLQVSVATVVLFYLITVRFVSFAIVDYFWIVFLPRPLVLLFEEDGDTYDWLSDIFKIESVVFYFSANETLFYFFISAFLSLFLLDYLSVWVASLNWPVSSLLILNFVKKTLKIKSIILTVPFFLTLPTSYSYNEGYASSLGYEPRYLTHCTPSTNY